MTKCRPITRTSLQDNINSLPIVGGRYSTTRTRNAFALLIISIEAFDPSSYCYNLSSNNDGSLCKLLLLEECIFLSMLIKCWLIRRKVVCGEITTIIWNDQWTSFKSEYELVHIEIVKSKVDVLVANKLRRRDVSSIRIGNKNYPLFLKASKQYKSCHPPQALSVVYVLHPLWTRFLTQYLGTNASIIIIIITMYWYRSEKHQW